jgi:2-oxo-4-hydroxy-4-carboxy--5-ureidoimidazoline (OHCU) decarboxylase
MLYTEGILTAEDRTLRLVARTTVNAALRSIETKTSQLVDSLVQKLTAQTTSNCTADHVLRLVLAHPQLASETATIERYSEAFPELRDAVSRSLERIETKTRARLERAFAPFEFQRRFRFARVRHCH